MSVSMIAASVMQDSESAGLRSESRKVWPNLIESEDFSRISYFCIFSNLQSVNWKLSSCWQSPAGMKLEFARRLTARVVKGD